MPTVLIMFVVQIYYLVAPNRATALKSPYYETFKKHNKEVLLLYHTVDDFVMSNIKTYEGSSSALYISLRVRFLEPTVCSLIDTCSLHIQLVPLCYCGRLL